MIRLRRSLPVRARPLRVAALLFVGLVVGLGGCRLLQQPPLAPVDVTASDGAYTDRVAITWTASPGATGYEIYRAPGRDETYTELGGTAETGFDDTTAEPAAVYWYKVKACNTRGCSGFSTPDSGYASVLPPPPPPPPG